VDDDSVLNKESLPAVREIRNARQAFSASLGVERVRPGSSLRLPTICRQGCEAEILNWATHGEVVETLPLT
jgi:hypothetical protein